MICGTTCDFAMTHHIVLGVLSLVSRPSLHKRKIERTGEMLFHTARNGKLGGGGAENEAKVYSNF